jgi:Tripartite tricarboxylate transporter TctB family
MKPIFKARSLLGLSVTVIGAYAFYASWDWPNRTALFPRIISVPLVVLGALETLLCLYGAEKQREGAAVDFELSADVDPVTARNRTLSLFLWNLGFFALIFLVGFPLAVPLFVCLYLKMAGKEGWGLTLLLTVLSWFFMEGLFDWLLHIPFAPGWLSFLWSS